MYKKGKLTRLTRQEIHDRGKQLDLPDNMQNKKRRKVNQTYQTKSTRQKEVARPTTQKVQECVTFFSIQERQDLVTRLTRHEKTRQKVVTRPNRQYVQKS